MLGAAGVDVVVSAMPGQGCEPPDWQPDEVMVSEVLSAPKSFLRMTRLGSADRAFLVAGLSVRGMVAEEIADRTHCSLRLIRTIRSWEMTQVCRWVHGRLLGVESELFGERAAHAVTRRELAESRGEVVRLRGQLDQLVAAHAAGAVGVFACGHPRVRYNEYRWAGGGKSYCRECRRGRQAARRGRRGAAPVAVTGLTVNC